MANSGSGNSGPTGSGHGNREQFDHFDRLSEVDQKDLNTDKMKADDKEADVEELLATEDETNSITEELDGSGSPSDSLALDLDIYNKDANIIPPIEEINNSKSSQQAAADVVDEESTDPLLDSTIQPGATRSRSNSCYN